MNKVAGLFAAIILAFSGVVSTNESASGLDCAEKERLLNRYASLMAGGDVSYIFEYRQLSKQPCTPVKIPGSDQSKQGGGSSGRSGGSSGGSGSSSPQCSGAPKVPSISHKWTLTGVEVTITPNLSGQFVDNVQYIYMLRDRETGSWGGSNPSSAWIGPVVSRASSPITLTFTQDNSNATKFIFQAGQGNACGFSGWTGLNGDRVPHKILNPPQDEINQTGNLINRGESIAVSQLFQTKSGNVFDVSVLTPKVCILDEGKITGRARGKCRIAVTTTSSAELLGTTQKFSISVARAGTSITCVRGTNKRDKLTVSGKKPSCPSGYARG